MNGGIRWKLRKWGRKKGKKRRATQNRSQWSIVFIATASDCLGKLWGNGRDLFPRSWLARLLLKRQQLAGGMHAGGEGRRRWGMGMKEDWITRCRARGKQLGSAWCFYSSKPYCPLGRQQLLCFPLFRIKKGLLFLHSSCFSFIFPCLLLCTVILVRFFFMDVLHLNFHFFWQIISEVIAEAHAPCFWIDLRHFWSCLFELLPLYWLHLPQRAANFFLSYFVVAFLWFCNLLWSSARAWRRKQQSTGRMPRQGRRRIWKWNWTTSREKVFTILNTR